MNYEERSYRKYSQTEGLNSFNVTVKETDLFISASKKLRQEALDAVVQSRFIIEQYIKSHPEFATSLVPLPLDKHAPDIIQKMLQAGKKTAVGPMAAVAGAVAEYTGQVLLKSCDEVLVENGGDIFFKVNRELTISIFAGESPLSEKIGVKIPQKENAYSICTSSGKVGPSLSLGSSDAVTITSASATLADAAATAIGNIIKTEDDIQKGIDIAQKVTGIDGIIIIKDTQLGVWGEIELINL